jgi:hypothetical protein
MVSSMIASAQVGISPEDVPRKGMHRRCGFDGGGCCRLIHPSLKSRAPSASVAKNVLGPFARNDASKQRGVGTGVKDVREVKSGEK